MKSTAWGAVLVLGLLVSVAEASNGEKPTAFGAAAGGRGGVDYAYAEDATAAQTNPGGLGFVNDRLDWDSVFLLALGHFDNRFGRENLSPQWTVAPLFQLGVVVDPTAPIRIGDIAEDKWGLTPQRDPNDFGGPFHFGAGIFTNQGAAFTFRHIVTPFYAPAALLYRADEHTVSFSAMFAFRVTDWLSIGYVPSFRYSQVLIDSTIEQPNTGLTTSFQAVIPSVQTYAQSHNLDSYGFSQRIGIKLKTQYVSAGAVYQDRSYSSDYKGQIVQDSSAGILKLPPPALASLIQVLDPRLGFASKYDARLEKHESPREFGLGIQVSPIDRFSIGLDYTYIMWSEVRRSLQVRLTGPRNRNFLILSGPTVQIHDALDWTDQSVIAVGVQATVLQGDDLVAGFSSYRLILRAGYNWGQSPQPKNTLNPALPLIFEHHASAGFSFHLGPFFELSNSVIHGFSSVDKTGINHANSELSFSKTEIRDWAVLTQLSVKF